MKKKSKELLEFINLKTKTCIFCGKRNWSKYMRKFGTSHICEICWDEIEYRMKIEKKLNKSNK